MTKDEIIAMAREAGFVVTYIGDPIGTNYAMIERLVSLVAAKATAVEREACAKLCEEAGTVEQWDGLSEAADRIRARGEA